jgi:Kef-type K+ transport system membrane component KefB
MSEKQHEEKQHDEPLTEEKTEARKFMDMKDKSDRLDFAFLAASMILFAAGIELVRMTQTEVGPNQTLYAVATILVTAFAAYFGHIYVKLMKD